MSPRRLNLDDLASALPAGGRTLVLASASESRLLADAVMAAGTALGAMTFTGMIIPGVNSRVYLANPACRFETFFLTPELKAAGNAVSFLPLCYGDVLNRLRSIKIDAALFMTTPPDAEGLCNFGPSVDFLAELWPRIPVRIAHLNPRLPLTRGPCAIPFVELTAYVEGEQELLGFAERGEDPVAETIAGHIAKWIPNGATIQTGIGKIPTAALRALRGHRDLRFHSGLIPEAVVDLEDAGALAPGASVVGGVAIGSPRLYDRIRGEAYEFRPVSHTHSPRVIAGIETFVALNSALEVDLFGQAYSELGPGGLMSGPGGASDYARSAWIAGGLRIVALAATAAKGKISRIVAPGANPGPVSLGRMDIDIVITEFGSADLRGLGHGERARALIGIAPPSHRDELERSWSGLADKF
jgi:acyl-CoA hydrolase